MKRIYLLFVLLVLAASSLRGQSTFCADPANAGSFFPALTLTTGTTPYSIASGDLDGDGKSEIAVVNYSQNNVSVYLNTSTSTITFNPRVNFAVGSNPTSVIMVDVDGDGRKDIVTANIASNTISVLRNTSTAPGTLSFAAKVDFSVGSTSSLVAAAADIDGDGKQEIITGNYSGNISVFRNTATAGSITTASLAAPVVFAVDTGTVAVKAADLNGDGKPDLVTSNYEANTLSILTNSSALGSVSFLPEEPIILAGGPTILDVADLNSDGRIDIAVPLYSTSVVSVYQNDYSGGTLNAASFASPVNFPTAAGPNEAVLKDVDGDALPDIITADFDANKVSVLRNNGLGTMAAGAFAGPYSFSAGALPLEVIADDLNLDGRPDLASVNRSSNSVTVFFNTGKTAAYFETLGNVAATTTIAAHEAADGFDNDQLLYAGTADLRSTTPSPGSAGANVFFATGSEKVFTVSGISTLDIEDPELSFWIQKSLTSVNGSEFIVEYSEDGSVFSPLTFPLLPATATWNYRRVNESLPETDSLILRFRVNSSASYRIDDIMITGTRKASVQLSGPAEVCAGTTVTLTAEAGSSYLWSNGEISQSITTDTSGVFTVTVTTNCARTSNPVTITVNPLPVVSAAPVSPLCDNDTPLQLNNASPAGGIYSGPGVSSDGSSYVFSAPAGSHTVTYTFTDTNGCSSSTTFSIPVNASPVVTAPSALEMCLGDTITLSGSAPEGGVYLSSFVFNDSLYSAPAGASPVIYEVTDSATTCKGRDTIMITTHSLPEVLLQIDDRPCENTSDFPLVQGVPSGGAYSGTGVYFTGTEYFFDATSGGSVINYSFTDTVTGCSNSATAVLEVDTLVPASALDAQTCSESGLLLLNGLPAGGVFSGPGVSTSAGNYYFDPTFGSRPVYYEFTNGSCITADTAAITVITNPDPFWFFPVLDFCSTDSEIEMAASPSYAVFSGPGVAEISGSFYFSPSLAGAGNHVITLSADTAGCIGETTYMMSVNDCSGIDDQGKESLRVYPNPVTGANDVVVSGCAPGECIMIIDNSGRTTQVTTALSGNVTIHMESLAAGVYYIKASSSASGVRVVKLP